MAELLDIEDHAALLDYLRRLGKIGDAEKPSVRTLAGGVSNKTVLVERPTGESWVLKQALPKLRVKVDWFSDPSRIRREAEALRWLPKLVGKDTVSALIFEDAEHHLFAMEAVPQPHENLKAILLETRELNPQHFARFGSIVGSIHHQAYRHRREVRPVFEDRSFFESLRIEPYYEYTASQVPAASAFLRELVRETRSTSLTLVHGDYSPKNVLVRSDGRMVLLDHEVVHWGDPAFDIGFALTHLLSKGHHRPKLRRSFAESSKVFWQAYQGHLKQLPWHIGVEQRVVLHTLGCLLARVAGRSPLEYLLEKERNRQRDVVVGLMARPPADVETLVTQFLEGV